MRSHHHNEEVARERLNVLYEDLVWIRDIAGQSISIDSITGNNLWRFTSQVQTEQIEDDLASETPPPRREKPTGNAPQNFAARPRRLAL
ncbi:hypothetical protein GCM10027515_08720 [Schumannella luteola]